MGMKEPPLFSGAESSRILLAADIRNLVRSHGLIAPFEPDENLASSTYDLTAGAKAVVTGGVEHTIRPDSTLKLGAGEYVGIISREKVCIRPNILVHLGPKKRLAYEGIILLSGSVIHPGYEGHCLFVLFNSSGSRRVISLGRKICAAVFYQLDRDVPKEELQRADPALLVGNFPAEFLNAMTNMELPTLTEVMTKLAGITLIETRIRELEREYKDVREPIKKLGETVDKIADAVKALTVEGAQVLGKISQHDTKLDAIGKGITKHGVWIVVIWAVIFVVASELLRTRVRDAVSPTPPAPQPQTQPQAQPQPQPQPPAQVQPQAQPQPQPQPKAQPPPP
jgi:deoxycytidine triphosphate deaminase